MIQGIPHIGELRELGLGSYSSPPGLLQNLIEFCSATTALPWACGIAMTTVILRTAMLPLVIKSMRNNVRLSNIQPEIMQLNERLQALTKAGDKAGAALVTDKMRQLFEDNQCHPLASFAPVLVQFPLFLSFFFAIRSMTTLPVCACVPARGRRYMYIYRYLYIFCCLYPHKVCLYVSLAALTDAATGGEHGAGWILVVHRPDGAGLELCAAADRLVHNGPHHRGAHRAVRACGILFRAGPVPE